MSTQKRSSDDYMWAAESPFLDHELLIGEDDGKLEPRQTAPAAESPFQSVFEQGRGRADSPVTPEFEEESFSEAETGVINGDNRVRIKDTVGVPWRWICKITIKDNRGRYHSGGTGVLISDRHVLTAAHVVYPEYIDPYSYSIEVTPALNDGDEPFGTYSLSAKPKIPKNYDPNEDDHLDWDYALITLKESVGKKTFSKLGGAPLCYWGHPTCGAQTIFVRPDPGKLNGRSVFTAGYPQQKGGIQLWCAAGILHSVNSRRRTMGITADTTKGQSGSPIWIAENGKYCLVGIAVGASTQSNFAVRVTRELIRQLRAWIIEDGVTPSIIETEEALEAPAAIRSDQEPERYEPHVTTWSPELSVKAAEDFTDANDQESEFGQIREQLTEERFDLFASSDDAAGELEFEAQWAEKEPDNYEGNLDPTHRSAFEFEIGPAEQELEAPGILRYRRDDNDESPVIIQHDVQDGPVREVSVGQRILLDLSKTAFAAKIDKVKWTIPGKIVRGYDGTVNDAKLFELTETDLQQTKITFFWVDAADGRTVRAKIRTTSGADEEYVVVYNVKGPKVTAFTAKVDVTRLEKRGGLTGMRFGKLIVSPGIKWDWNITLPTTHAGYIKDVQTVLVDRSRIMSLKPGGKETQKWVWKHPKKTKPHLQLDGHSDGQAAYTAGLYEPKFDPGYSFHNQGTSDSPHTDLPSLARTVSINDQFTYFIMFKPATDNPYDAIWVPVAKAKWSWKATAVNQGKQWDVSQPKMKPSIDLKTVDFPMYETNASENEWQEDPPKPK